MAMSAPRRYRLALTALLIVALVASLFVAAVRVRKEHGANRVELAMDYQDFSALAKSYGYNEEQFLVALRRAGLTSLAISEELGSNIDLGTGAVLLSGPQLIAQMRLSPLADPTLAALGRAGRIDPNDLYLIVYDPNELARYRSAIAMHLGAHATRTLRPAHPTILAIRSQIDYFNSLGLGLPAGQLALAHKLGLLVVPRVQNDERFDKSDIDATFAGFFAQHAKPTTVVFFGTRNEVLGFPDHLDDVADAFKRTHLSFGSIETYDKIQVQKGNDELARKIANQTTRVQAISKTELDKLDFETVVARYLLGARERNVRVVYLRPFPHATGDLSPEKTNIEMVRRIADGLRARGFRLGRATPVPDLPVSPVVIFVASLAVPAIFLLLLEAFGIRRAPLAYAVIAADVVLVALGYASGHGLLIRKLLALAGGIMFATMGVVAIPRAFTLPAPRALGASIVAGFRTLGVATGFALCGALVIVGLVSVPLLMEEIDHFSGVKLILAVPPLLALLLYIYTRRFGNEPPDARTSALAPVRVYQIAIVALLAGAAAVYVLRSGNQSDITPSAFELSLRSGLTAVLGVRPRFKEFLVGFPLMMLLPALRLEHRKLLGWLFAIGIAIGTSDIVDTFSHLHTPLVVSLLRVFNGAVIGAIVGIIAILIYRAIWKPARA
jgi:hypothetical protein